MHYSIEQTSFFMNIIKSCWRLSEVSYNSAPSDMATRYKLGILLGEEYRGNLRYRYQTAFCSHTQ